MYCRWCKKFVRTELWKLWEVSMQVVRRKLWLTGTSVVRRGGNWGKLSDSWESKLWPPLGRHNKRPNYQFTPARNCTPEQDTAVQKILLSTSRSRNHIYIGCAYWWVVIAKTKMKKLILIIYQLCTFLVNRRQVYHRSQKLVSSAACFPPCRKEGRKYKSLSFLFCTIHEIVFTAFDNRHDCIKYIQYVVNRYRLLHPPEIIVVVVADARRRQRW